MNPTSSKITHKTVMLQEHTTVIYTVKTNKLVLQLMATLKPCQLNASN